MFGLTMCHCLRKLFKVGSLFKLLFAYNTFVPFSFTGESTTSIYSHFTSLVGETGVGCHTGWLSHCQYLIHWMSVPCGDLHVTCA